MQKTYRQPTEIRMAAWIYIALATLTFLILFISYWQGQTTDLSALIGIPALFAPFYIGAWWLVWHFRGEFILTDEGITLSQFGNQTFLRYADIHTITERESQLLPYLRLTTSEQSMTIAFKVKNFSDLYANLRRRIAALRAAERQTLPIKLRINRKHFQQAGSVLLVYFIFTGTLSIGAALEQTPGEYWRGLIIWAFFIIIAVGGALMNEWKTPYALSVDRENIEARYLLNGTRVFRSAELIRVEREAQVRYLRYGSKMVVYPLVLTFANGERLQIEEARTWAFGYSPDRLIKILTCEILEKS